VEKPSPHGNAPKGPVKGWKNTNQWDTGANSKLLRENMGAAVKPGEDAHHIVLSTDPRAEVARNILDRYQIDINDASNGVGLKPTGERPAHHGQGLHSNEGIRAVEERLREATRGISDWATGRERVLQTLADIRNAILNGMFP
jgi:hypothetical protein